MRIYTNIYNTGKILHSTPSSILELFQYLSQHVILEKKLTKQMTKQIGENHSTYVFLLQCEQHYIN